MSETMVSLPPSEAVEVPLGSVERELARRLKSVYGPGDAPVHRARMSNLIIYCTDEARANLVESEIPDIVKIHPARVLLLVADETAPQTDVKASVLVRPAGNGTRLAAEQVTLRAGGHASEHLPFAVRGLLIGDLPTNVWWANPKPPPLAGPVLDDLAENAEQVIYDSLGWADPHRGISTASSWLSRFERSNEDGRWRVASDLNWRRLKYWRRLISQEFAPKINPGALETVTEIKIEHGPHAVTQAWLLAGWLSSRLGWKIQATKFKQGQEIAIQLVAPHGTLNLVIDRLPEGPSEIRRVRIACSVGGQLGALNFVVEEEGRLSVQPEGLDCAARTLSAKPVGTSDIVGRQLSDREPDPIFHQSMEAAHLLAQAVLR
jgi:glucose-6-phosphate dehydrogenase assembly protein OpcA